MNLGDLFDETVLPQNDKQIVAKPPSYEDSLQDIYVDPQYFQEQPDELPPEYDEDEAPDYEIDNEDMQKDILNKLHLQDGWKTTKKKGETPDYNIHIEDEVPDMNLGDLFDETVLPQNDKQIVAKPPSYEDSLQDIYVDPQYFQEQPDELPPEYDEDEAPDYEIDNEDMQKDILNKLHLQDYENVDKILAQEQMNPQRSKKYLQRPIKKQFLSEIYLKVTKQTSPKTIIRGKYLQQKEN
ncbi:hypothetical protein AWC38_SpisGene14803 [Stylophora pistillata]|uniref:Uncharacterized protein n=1 Tax=Stylophora pistillata TaxID=50429 RepID=A0A2B4RQM9_STYPI|nr:hypothetical protein AWC38_SpisGene14803 [Stylophora pistillata]